VLREILGEEQRAEVQKQSVAVSPDKTQREVLASTHCTATRLLAVVHAPQAVTIDVDEALLPVDDGGGTALPTVAPEQAAVVVSSGDGETSGGMAPPEAQPVDCTPSVLRAECEELFPATSRSVVAIEPGNRAKLAMAKVFAREKHPKALQTRGGQEKDQPMKSVVRAKRERDTMAVAPPVPAAQDEAVERCTPAEYWSIAFPQVPKS